MSKPAVHIAVFAGEPKPSVFSTALNPRESRMIAAWLTENPDLDELVRSALRLAQAEDDQEWPPRD